MEPTTIYDFNPMGLPKDILAAVGLVAMCSVQTENVVEYGIAGCLGIDMVYGASVTTHMNAPLRDNVLRSVAEIKIDDLDDLDKLDELLDRVNESFRRRNNYLHQRLCIYPKTGECYRTKIESRGSLDTDLTLVDVKTIVADADFIYETGMTLYNFLAQKKLLPGFPPAPYMRAHKTKSARKKRRKTVLGGK